jgi:hypothetical protein
VKSFGESKKRSYEMNKCLSLVHLTGSWVEKLHASDGILHQPDVLLLSSHLLRGIAERFVPADLTDNRLPLCQVARGVVMHLDVLQLHPPNSYRGNGSWSRLELLVLLQHNFSDRIKL